MTRRFLGNYSGPGPEAEAFNPALRIGNIVVLNSGGPRMMVVDIGEGSRVTVSWQTPAGETREMEIPTACLYRCSIL
jgi:uncharacterized protein YodC (DUF2158 family)